MKSKKAFKTRVYAFRDQLVFVTSSEKLIEGVFYPFGDGRIGNVLCDSGKHLECSKEAIRLMEQMETGTDCIGDIDWFGSEKDGDTFGWFGPSNQVMTQMNRRVTARGFRILAYKEIPNKLPAEIVEVLVGTAKKSRKRPRTKHAPV